MAMLNNQMVHSTILGSPVDATGFIVEASIWRLLQLAFLMLPLAIYWPAGTLRYGEMATAGVMGVYQCHVYHPFLDGWNPMKMVMTWGWCK